MSDRAPRTILWFSCALFFALTILNIAHHPLSAPTTQIDEQAHISYAMHLISQHCWWPDFSDFRMVNTATLAPLTAQNYLNHPPTFYWLMKLMNVVNPIDFRLIAFLFYTAAMLLYKRIGTKLMLPIIGAVLYAALPFLLSLQLQIGFYNNDAAAMFGGLLATSASVDWFLRLHSARRSFWWMVLGVAFASVKLTAFLLVGSYVLACIALCPLHRALTKRDWLFAILTGIVLIIPYALMLHFYGHLAPETAGQLQLMQHPPGNDWVRTPYDGWQHAQALTFIAWLGEFFANFADQLRGPELTFLALLVLLFGFVRVVSCRPRLGIACLIATAITLTVHAAFAWHRYRTYGWLLDSLIRYYFPLLGAYGAVCAEAVKRRQHETRR